MSSSKSMVWYHIIVWCSWKNGANMSERRGEHLYVASELLQQSSELGAQDFKRTAWSNTTIHAVVSDLSGRGFDCYWAGANGNLALMAAGHSGNSDALCYSQLWVFVCIRSSCEELELGCSINASSGISGNTFIFYIYFMCTPATIGRIAMSFLC